MMTRRLVLRVPVLLAAALLLLAHVPACRADMPSEAVLDRAYSMIEGQQSVIGRYMYPTSNLQSIERRELKIYSSGEFKLTYRFHFKWFKSSFYGDMHFSFDPKGALLFCTPGGHNTTWGPGVAADGFILVLQALGAEVPAGLTPRGALEWWLRRF
jgi:hypothetical protein